MSKKKKKKNHKDGTCSINNLFLRIVLTLIMRSSGKMLAVIKALKTKSIRMKWQQSSVRKCEPVS